MAFMMSARTRHRLNRRLGRLKTVFGALLHRRNYKTLLLGTSFGQGSILAVIAVIAVFIATALFFGYRTGDEADKDFMEFAWTAYIFFVDPGSHTELSSDSNTQVEISIGVLISWIGFIWMMMVFGVIVDVMLRLLEKWRRKYSVVLVSRHTVLLGWTSKTLFLLGEAAQMLTDGPDHGGQIVILGELDVVEMKEEIALTYPRWKKHWPRVNITCRQGKAYEVDDLQRVSIGSALHVIVLGTSQNPRHADSLVLSTLCAMKCLPDVDAVSPHTPIVLELQIPRRAAAPARAQPHTGRRGL